MPLNDIQKDKIKELYKIYSKDYNDSTKLSRIFGQNATPKSLKDTLGYTPQKGLDIKVWAFINENKHSIINYSLGEIILLKSGCPSFSYRRELNIDTDSLSNILCPKLAKFHNKTFKYYWDKSSKVMDKLCPYAVLKSIT